MDLSLTETQLLLQRTARDFLRDACPTSLVRQAAVDPQGYSPELWRQIVEIGWPGILVPVEQGGIGGSILDAVILFEEVGRFLPPAPLFSTAITGALVLQHAGNEAQRQHWLPQVAAGDAILTLAFPEASGTWDPSGVHTRLEAEGDGYRLSGEKLFVHDAQIADRIIVVARVGDSPDGLKAVLVDPKTAGVSLLQLKTIGYERQFAVRFENVAIDAADVLPGDWEAIFAALQRATLVKCAEMVGGCQHVMEMTVDYAKKRVAFGRPIGAFQAIQHKCANMAANILGLRMIVYETAWMVDEGLPAALDVAICKNMAGDVFRETTTEGHQIHAGLAYTIDHDMHLFHRRVPASDQMFGDSDYQSELAATYLDL